MPSWQMGHMETCSHSPRSISFLDSVEVCDCQLVGYGYYDSGLSSPILHHSLGFKIDDDNPESGRFSVNLSKVVFNVLIYLSILDSQHSNKAFADMNAARKKKTITFPHP